MDRAGFKIVKLGLNECNGGSFRIYVAKRGCGKYTEDVECVRKYLEQETLHGIHTLEAYNAFNARCRVEAEKLKQFLTWCALDKKKVYIYGASTKGNCLLQYAGVGPDLVPYAVERNPLKYGKMTSTEIPIIDEETMRRDNPEYLLVLPWHFREGIITREAEYLQGGGTLIFPFPHFELVSKKKRALITGVDGQISRYLVPKLQEEYQIVGITRNAGCHGHNVLRIVHDLEEESVEWLESLYVTLRPDVILHNASITNTEACENNPLGAMKLNGMIVGTLCEIIHKYGWPCKLFHASSSENYKKHGRFMVTDDEEEFSPQSVYGICKTFGHQMVDYYRKKYKLPFSNGIIFTTESRYRKNNFLLRKVFHHAKAWVEGQKSVLSLGALDSYRNLIHADDVANAIVCILRQEVGNNYVICGEEIRKVEDLVKKIYELFGIILEKEGKYYVDATSASREKVLEIGGVLREGMSHIHGLATRLKNLGWVQKYDVDAILRDVCMMD
jgi:GDP-D-mannose dehydratase